MDQVSHASGSPIMQVAFVVENIEQEMLRWTSTLHIGPFFYLPHFPVIEAQYRGKPANMDIDVALAFNGGMCFELISQRNDDPSPYRELAGGARSGFHHFATGTQSFDAELERHQRDGMSFVAMAKVAVGGRVAYFEKPGLPGMLEVIEITPAAEQLFGMIRAASVGWDGTDPIRRLGP